MYMRIYIYIYADIYIHIFATHRNTVQHTATHLMHCNTLQHTATHCNTLDVAQKCE